MLASTMMCVGGTKTGWNCPVPHDVPHRPLCLNCFKLTDVKRTSHLSAKLLRTEDTMVQMMLRATALPLLGSWHVLPRDLWSSYIYLHER